MRSSPSPAASLESEFHSNESTTHLYTYEDVLLGSMDIAASLAALAAGTVVLLALGTNDLLFLLGVLVAAGGNLAMLRRKAWAKWWARMPRHPDGANPNEGVFTMTRMIVTYFSATGTTESAAEALARATGAELYRIEPAERYTRRDLDWNDASSRTSAERNDESARPSLEVKAPDLSVYDAVLVGFPIWWAVEPRIVDSFLDSVNLAGTTVVPFATSGGSGVSCATERIRKLHPEARVLDGRVLNGSPFGSRLAEWIDGLGV